MEESDMRHDEQQPIDSRKHALVTEWMQGVDDEAVRCAKRVRCG